ncbi:hypothetical protein PG994_009347 [Apiospora phragmitis]|uniref:Ubiquitin 3 binding protein But2 C-terminal domain-containing protein n=1 Tax=Apiospora phragmitis TaxID=2905665 RepID=A0ABR1UJ25_9PEZI
MKTTILATTFAATALAVPTMDALRLGLRLPSLLLQISAKEPNKTFPASVTAEVTPGDKCTIFNLDLPVKETKNKVCNLVFDFPDKPEASLKALSQKMVSGFGGDLVADHRRPRHDGGKEGGAHEHEHKHHHRNHPRQSSPLASSLDYLFDGPGNFHFIGYDLGVGAVAGKTTYAHQPAPGPSPADAPPKLQPGHSYVINSAPCEFPANVTSVKVSGALCSDDTHLRYDQGYLGTCPMGFYVVLTDAAK